MHVDAKDAISDDLVVHCCIDCGSYSWHEQYLSMEVVIGMARGVYG